MVLSDQEIEKLVHSQKLITPFKKNRLQSVSYDISTSETIRVYQRLNNPINLNDKTQLELATVDVNISSGYHIKPGEYILVKTEEFFNIPDNLSARIRPRTTFTRFGLLLIDQHLNPSFSGHLYLGLYNATLNIINIFPDVQVGQIVFEQVKGEITKDRLYKNQAGAKYQNETSFIVPRLDKESERNNRIQALIEKALAAD